MSTHAVGARPRPQSTLLPAQTGLRRLDAALDGGIPRGATFLVVADALAGADRLLQAFLAEGVRRQEPTNALLTDGAVDEWKARIAVHLASARQLKAEDALRFYVCGADPPGAAAPSGAGATRPSGAGASEENVPLTLEAVVGLCKDLLGDVRKRGFAGRFVLDSLTTLAHEFGTLPTLRAMPALLAQARALETAGLVAADAGVLPKDQLRLFMRHFDGVIHLKAGGQGLHMQAQGTGRAKESFPYRIEGHRLEARSDAAVPSP